MPTNIPTVSRQRRLDMSRLDLPILAMGVVAFLFAGCESAQRSAPQVGVPAYILEGLKKPGAEKAKVYVDSAGHLVKYEVYIDCKGVPEWVMKMADDKLGQGESRPCEMERYADGDEVYEVTRIVEGKERELSVKTNQTLKYIERSMTPEELPEAIKATVAKVAGFQLEEAAFKEGPMLTLFVLKGKKEGRAYRLEIQKGGELSRESQILQGEVVVDVK
jgi:hypothetical protein